MGTQLTSPMIFFIPVYTNPISTPRLSTTFSSSFFLPSCYPTRPRTHLQHSNLVPRHPAPSHHKSSSQGLRMINPINPILNNTPCPPMDEIAPSKVTIHIDDDDPHDRVVQFRKISYVDIDSRLKKNKEKQQSEQKDDDHDDGFDRLGTNKDDNYEDLDHEDEKQLGFISLGEEDDDDFDVDDDDDDNDNDYPPKRKTQATKNDKMTIRKQKDGSFEGIVDLDADWESSDDDEEDKKSTQDLLNWKTPAPSSKQKSKDLMNWKAPDTSSSNQKSSSPSTSLRASTNGPPFKRNPFETKLQRTQKEILSDDDDDDHEVDSYDDDDDDDEDFNLLSDEDDQPQSPAAKGKETRFDFDLDFNEQQDDDDDDVDDDDEEPPYYSDEEDEQDTPRFAKKRISLSDLSDSDMDYDEYQDDDDSDDDDFQFLSTSKAKGNGVEKPTTPVTSNNRAATQTKSSEKTPSRNDEDDEDDQYISAPASSNQPQFKVPQQRAGISSPRLRKPREVMPSASQNSPPQSYFDTSRQSNSSVKGGGRGEGAVPRPIARASASGPAPPIKDRSVTRSFNPIHEASDDEEDFSFNIAGDKTKTTGGRTAKFTQVDDYTDAEDNSSAFLDNNTQAKSSTGKPRFQQRRPDEGDKTRIANRSKLITNNEDDEDDVNLSFLNKKPQRESGNDNRSRFEQRSTDLEKRGVAGRGMGKEEKEEDEDNDDENFSFLTNMQGKENSATPRSAQPGTGKSRGNAFMIEEEDQDEVDDDETFSSLSSSRPKGNFVSQMNKSEPNFNKSKSSGIGAMQENSDDEEDFSFLKTSRPQENRPRSPSSGIERNGMRQGIDFKQQQQQQQQRVRVPRKIEKINDNLEEEDDDFSFLSSSKSNSGKSSETATDIKSNERLEPGNSKSRFDFGSLLDIEDDDSEDFAFLRSSKPQGRMSGTKSSARGKPMSELFGADDDDFPALDDDDNIEFDFLRSSSPTKSKASKSNPSNSGSRFGLEDPDDDIDELVFDKKAGRR